MDTVYFGMRIEKQKAYESTEPRHYLYLPSTYSAIVCLCLSDLPHGSRPIIGFFRLSFCFYFSV